MHKRWLKLSSLSVKDLVVLIRLNQLNVTNFYQECAGQSHFRSLCSKLGSTVRKWVLVLALHYVT